MLTLITVGSENNPVTIYMGKDKAESMSIRFFTMSRKSARKITHATPLLILC